MLKFEDKWFIAEGEENGKPIIIQGRGELGPIAGAPTHSKVLRIAWHYVGDENFNLPEEEQSILMDKFNDLIIPALEKDQLCIVYCIFLGNGIKEWAAYCSDVDKALEIFNQTLEGEAIFPVKLFVEEDPKWLDYHNMINETGQAEEV